MIARRLVSRLERDGSLTLRLRNEEVGSLAANALLLKVDAAPINPADLKAMLCSLEPDALYAVHDAAGEALCGNLPPELAKAFGWRLGVDMPLGNEGTGIVIAAGEADSAQQLIGKRVSTATRGMYSDHCIVDCNDCLVLSSSSPVELCAAAFVNPMTALAMLETMHNGGHNGLLLTAAASNLGKMVNRLCEAEGVPLVNIVRSDRARDALLELGADHICNSSDPNFRDHLINALVETGATIAFDAMGGGALAGQILHAMEDALARSAGISGPYGSKIGKQLYFFGGLDPAPVTFWRNFGMAWNIGGWLLQSELKKFSPAKVAAMKGYVVDRLDDIFSSEFAGTIALEQMLQPDTLQACMGIRTGGKWLVRP